ncbi:MAG: coenzyme F420-0:L-glutamate ligase [Anaerolineaceae bacterium]|nr:coenzyme F420-0:L-glutamate ligase [Anaerolineaceae bacterium]MDE0327893.1 coenzyme F420-0:L-glutamate ligase [Anaerolineaceae bacterium]
MRPGCHNAAHESLWETPVLAPLTIWPLPAPVRQAAFDLPEVIDAALARAPEGLREGDVLAVSSKYAAISEGRVLRLADVEVTPQALDLARRYRMQAIMAQLVLQEADHIFGGIEMGFLLTVKCGILSPNAGLDRSNIPTGQVVLFPARPYATAARLREALRQSQGVNVGVVLTDSWLVPGRLGTSGVALATAGFRPVKDERGRRDLFGNPMTVTQRGMADTISAAAQLVMGERDEATPLAIVRGSGVDLDDAAVSPADVAIPWQQCIYVESLTRGLLADDAASLPGSSAAEAVRA